MTGCPKNSARGGAVRGAKKLGLGITLAVALAAQATAGSAAGAVTRGEPLGRVLPAAPVISGLSARPGTTGALLKARIRPQGLETTYRFYLELCANSECIDHVLIGEGTIAATTKAQTVEASTYIVLDELGLEPGTRYEYWVTATNADGSTTRLKTFKTHK